MRSFGQNAGCALLVTLFACTAGAQQAPKSTVGRSAKITQPQPALLAPDDGMTVIAAALETRGRSSKTDCSHLVHEIYERAGFSYDYIPSSDIYAGSDEFRRVTHPQPGDLVAWPGHVGVLISPLQHSFFSALNSGLGVDFYDSAYWKTRGKPRFFRFVKDTSAPSRVASRTVAELKNTSLQTNSGGAPLEASAEEVSQAVPKVAEKAPTAVVVPRILVEGAKPTPEQVSAALLQALSETGDSLRGQDVFQLKRDLAIVNRLDIRQVKLKGDRGWAEVQVEESASLTKGQLNLKARREKQRWTMVRVEPESWELLPPQPNLYVNHDDAVTLLAHQLAEMTGPGASPGNPGQKAQMRTVAAEHSCQARTSQNHSVSYIRRSHSRCSLSKMCSHHHRYRTMEKASTSASRLSPRRSTERLTCDELGVSSRRIVTCRAGEACAALSASIPSCTMRSSSSANAPWAAWNRLLLRENSKAARQVRTPAASTGSEAAPNTVKKIPASCRSANHFGPESGDEAKNTCGTSPKNLSMTAATLAKNIHAGRRSRMRCSLRWARLARYSFCGFSRLVR